MNHPGRIVHLGDPLTTISYGDERTEYVRGDLYDAMEINRNAWRKRFEDAQCEITLLRQRWESRR